MKFECHVTCLSSQADLAQNVATALGWKTSQIARDPVLGDDTFFYLTMYDTDYMTLYHRMKFVAYRLMAEGCTVVREKIELIMFDTKGKQ